MPIERRRFITARGSKSGYPRSVLRLEQGLTILFSMCLWQERVKRKSWAAGQDRDFKHEAYVHYHLHQSESWSDISSSSHNQDTTTADTTTTDDVMGSPEFALPSHRPITSLFSSARRRLGRRREPLSPGGNNIIIWDTLFLLKVHFFHFFVIFLQISSALEISSKW